jgi:two-component system alkaline phosphatase synthesis response regulator PhoP
MNNLIKVLVVDDEPDVVEILSYNLIKENYHVEKAYNGKEALQKAESVTPDLVIMDVRMPGLSGIETCRAFRTIESLKDVPVLFLTADSDEYTTMSAFDAGANHFITKPIRPSILMKMILELLSKDRREAI